MTKAERNPSWEGSPFAREVKGGDVRSKKIVKKKGRKRKRSAQRDKFTGPSQETWGFQGERRRENWEERINKAIRTLAKESRAKGGLEKVQWR